jgi:hypothetical protein
VPARLGIGQQVEHLALGDAELLADEVEPAGLLRDRVLHLQAGVDLQEGDEPVLPDEELHGAGAVVAGLPADLLRRLVDGGALGVGQERRGRLLHELLEAALQRAVPGADDDDVAVGVGEHLRLDVARLVQVALDEALAAAERGRGLAHRRVVQLGDLLLGAGDLHAAPPAAERGLDRHGQAVLAGEGEHLVGAGHRVVRAGHERRARAGGDVPGGDLVTEVADRLRGRADPGDARVDHGLGEVGVLRQEAVAGVDAVGAGPARRVDDLVEHEVGLRRGGAAEREGLVGQPDERRVPVGVGVHGDAGQPRVGARADDPDGDLAPVRDEDLAQARHGNRRHLLRILLSTAGSGRPGTKSPAGVWHAAGEKSSRRARRRTRPHHPRRRGADAPS